MPQRWGRERAIKGTPTRFAMGTRIKTLCGPGAGAGQCAPLGKGGWRYGDDDDGMVLRFDAASKVFGFDDVLAETKIAFACRPGDAATRALFAAK